ISLKSGLTFITRSRPIDSNRAPAPARAPGAKPAVPREGALPAPLESRGALLLEQREAAALLRMGRGLPLALQLDPEAQLVLRIRVPHRLVVRDHAVLIEVE